MAAADAFVYVGCRMPTGVVLNLRRTIVDRTGGMVVVSVEGQDHGVVTLRGTAQPAPRSAMTAPLEIDGYAFTPVPKAFWDAWWELNEKTSSLVADGFIKPAKTQGHMDGMSREDEMRPGLADRIVTDGNDPKNRYRSNDELAARNAGFQAQKFNPNDDGRAAA